MLAACCMYPDQTYRFRAEEYFISGPRYFIMCWLQLVTAGGRWNRPTAMLTHQTSRTASKPSIYSMSGRCLYPQGSAQCTDSTICQCNSHLVAQLIAPATRVKRAIFGNVSKQLLFDECLYETIQDASEMDEFGVSAYVLSSEALARQLCKWPQPQRCSSH